MGRFVIWTPCETGAACGAFCVDAKGVVGAVSRAVAEDSRTARPHSSALALTRSSRSRFALSAARLFSS